MTQKDNHRKYTGRRGVISLAFLSKPYILTYMKDARIHDGTAEQQHHRCAKVEVCCRCDVIVLRYPSCITPLRPVESVAIFFSYYRHIGDTIFRTILADWAWNFPMLSGK